MNHSKLSKQIFLLLIVPRPLFVENGNCYSKMARSNWQESKEACCKIICLCCVYQSGQNQCWMGIIDPIYKRLRIIEETLDFYTQWVMTIQILVVFLKVRRWCINFCYVQMSSGYNNIIDRGDTHWDKYLIHVHIC